MRLGAKARPVTRTEFPLPRQGKRDRVRGVRVTKKERAEAVTTLRFFGLFAIGYELSGLVWREIIFDTPQVLCYTSHSFATPLWGGIYLFIECGEL